MKSFAFLIFFLFSLQSFAQQKDSAAVMIYHPDADAEKDIAAAVKQASAEHKNVFIMVGGNWCRWCRMFEKFKQTHASVDSAFNAGYVFMHVNYSKENKNNVVMQQLEYPQRFGFPVFVILDDKGRRIHTQSTGYLEDGEGYSETKVIEFLGQWSQSAMKPELYK